MSAQVTASLDPTRIILTNELLHLNSLREGQSWSSPAPKLRPGPRQVSVGGWKGPQGVSHSCERLWRHAKCREQVDKQGREGGAEGPEISPSLVPGGRASVHAEALLPRLWSESSLVWHTVCGCVSCAPPPQRESDIAKASRRGESSQHVVTNTPSQSSEDAWS